MEEKTILLIEDNPTDEFLAERALARLKIGHRLIVAHDGVEALDYLIGTESEGGRDKQILPTIVLLDLKLPRISGLQVLEGIRSHEKTRNLPVLVLTSSSEEGDITACLQLGVSSFTTKPINSSQYMETVQKLVLSWLGTNEEEKE
jgi:two-component system, response regulator